jgi:hypothetical protein
MAGIAAGLAYLGVRVAMFAYDEGVIGSDDPDVRRVIEVARAALRPVDVLVLLAAIYASQSLSITLRQRVAEFLDRRIR